MQHASSIALQVQIKVHLSKHIRCYNLIINMSLHFQAAKQVINHFSHLSRALPKTEAVVQFQKAILEDPILRMNMELAIAKSHQTLQSKSIAQIMSVIDAAIGEPPSFTTYPLVGAPLNTIFCEFMQNENGRAFFSNSKVNLHLKNILNCYSSMLKSAASLKYVVDSEPNGWLSGSARQLISYDQVQCNQQLPHFGFSSWNQFFIRKFKAAARPLYGQGTPQSCRFITHSCQNYPLQERTMPVHNLQLTNTFWLKGNSYSLRDMFGSKTALNQSYAKLFQGGSLYQGFLSVFCYHRWHSPIDGEIVDEYLIQGTYLLDQSQFIQRTLDSPFYSQGFLTSVATRRVIVIKADNPEIGHIGLIYVGIADISSCISVVKKGQKVHKGQELGRFQIGGSSVAILFSKNPKIKFGNNLYDSSRPQLQKVNSLLAYLG